jgi:hypothetical protein
MHLRHIRPRSVEWYDALETEGGARASSASGVAWLRHAQPIAGGAGPFEGPAEDVARLSEEAARLRTLREMEGVPERKQSPRDRGRNYDS